MSEEQLLNTTTTRVPCCVAGGGPAGMMVGFLLARAGVKVLVLEKHKDFLRDFRGDTIHPSTLEIIHELGLLDDFLQLPHQELHLLAGQIGNETIPLADFSYLPTKCKFIAFMPQWHFLNFLAQHAAKYPTFQLRMEAEVTELIETNGLITGVRASTKTGLLEVAAELIIGADGRHSVVRERAHLQVQKIGAPIDVLWFRITRKPDDPSQALGRFAGGRIMVMLNRDKYWQCGFIIPKGDYEAIKRRGLAAFHEDIVVVASFLADRVSELNNWNDIRLLTVAVDRLLKWCRPGLLCIGDAAHAMSPVGGVGINLAIQDAVALANTLYGSLRNGQVPIAELERVQRRRQIPTMLTQAVQVFIQQHVIKRALGAEKRRSAPTLLRLFRYFPVLRRIPARLVGIGVRPEHVMTPDVRVE
jgi:2-polyprenyl-6-methoxyphenol hydroxylase-like FAD-dependent oxidoreductase